jgi:general secretion pathway protein G
MKRSPSKGFTLIELLVVIAIIGLLSTLAVVALNSARQRSRDAKRVSDIRQIQTALELGFSESNNYPTETATILGDANNDVLCNNGGVATFQADTTGCTTIYMGLVPTNPTPNGASYTYTSASNSGTYSITFSLEGATGQLGAGANCANQNGIQAGSSC